MLIFACFKKVHLTYSRIVGAGAGAPEAGESEAALKWCRSATLLFENSVFWSYTVELQGTASVKPKPSCNAAPVLSLLSKIFFNYMFSNSLHFLSPHLQHSKSYSYIPVQFLFGMLNCSCRTGAETLSCIIFFPWPDLHHNDAALRNVHAVCKLNLNGSGTGKTKCGFKAVPAPRRRF
jgi:hypothetical protein